MRQADNAGRTLHKGMQFWHLVKVDTYTKLLRALSGQVAPAMVRGTCFCVKKKENFTKLCVSRLGHPPEEIKAPKNTTGRFYKLLHMQACACARQQTFLKQRNNFFLDCKKWTSNVCVRYTATSQNEN